MERPLMIDLYCGLGGWAEGALAEGWQVVGFDIERHEYWVTDTSSDGDGMKGTKPVEKRGWTQGCAVSLGMEGIAARPLICTNHTWTNRVHRAIWTDQIHGNGIFGWAIEDCKFGPYPLRGYTLVTHWMPLPSPPTGEG